MTKVSDLLSKPIISIYDAKIIGTVSNIFFDAKMQKATVLSIYNDEAQEEAEESYVELSKLVSLDNEAAVIKSSDSITFLWNTNPGAPNPINRPAYTQDGRLLGVVKDVHLEGNKVTEFVVDSSIYPSDMLLSYSDKMIVFNDSGVPIKVPAKKKMPKIKVEQSVVTHIPKETSSVTLKDIDLPTRIPPAGLMVSKSSAAEHADRKFDFLIGKVIEKNIYNNQGALIAKENGVITQETVARAKQEGKLVQLALHSKTVQNG